MVFLQKDDHAVRQFDALGLLRAEGWKRRNFDLLPVRGLSCRLRHCDAAGDHKDERQENERKQFHCAPSFWPAAAGGAVSMMPTVRLVRDRKSTRLNSSHLVISYAVFCLKKKKKLKL